MASNSDITKRVITLNFITKNGSIVLPAFPFLMYSDSLKEIVETQCETLSPTVTTVDIDVSDYCLKTISIIYDFLIRECKKDYDNIEEESLDIGKYDIEQMLDIIKFDEQFSFAIDLGISDEEGCKKLGANLELYNKFYLYKFSLGQSMQKFLTPEKILAFESIRDFCFDMKLDLARICDPQAFFVKFEKQLTDKERIDFIQVYFKKTIKNVYKNGTTNFWINKWLYEI